MTIEASHILAKYTAKDLCRNDEEHPMIQFSASDTLSTIFEKLVEAHIFAAPVLREEPDEDGRRLMGVISLLDVIDSVVEIWHQVEQMPPPDMNKGTSLLRSAVRHDQLLHLLGRSIEITTERGDTATKRAKSDLLAVIVDEAPLDAVFELMTENHIHRVFVITADGEINNVITQRDMVFFLHDHLAEFEKMWNPEKSDTFFLDETVEHLGLIYAEVKAVKASERILAAFDTMVKNNLRAVPVVTSDGIIGVISASDFHVLSNWESPLDILKMDCHSFLSEKHRADLKAKIPALSCGAKTTLRDVIGKFHQSHVHRVYITNNDRFICGVVTLGSVLRAFLTNGGLN